MNDYRVEVMCMFNCLWYCRYLHAFEDFYRKLGSSMGTISRPGRSRNNSGRGIVQFRGKDKQEDKVRSSFVYCGTFQVI